MGAIVRVVLLVLVSASMGSTASGAAPRAEVARDEVRVAGKRVWPLSGAVARVTGPVSWAREGHAVALLARQERELRLVVVLVHGQAAGQVLEWKVPRAAQPARAIMWLDGHRVAVGPREMEPKLVASWSGP